jgi:hypothetical protein
MSTSRRLELSTKGPIEPIFLLVTLERLTHQPLQALSRRWEAVLSVTKMTVDANAACNKLLEAMCHYNALGISCYVNASE